MAFKTFGKNPKGERLERIENSFNYKEGKFQNIEPTAVNPNDISMFSMLRDFVAKPVSVKPSQELPYVSTNLRQLPKNKTSLVWFGHSSYFINHNGFTILVDPVFSGNASPVSFFGKAFPGADTYNPKDFPEIDLLLLTHDHYDHLDYPTIKQVKDKVRKIITSLGVGAHLEYWGIAASKIIEVNWWQKYTISPAMEITATPSRHFSGRGLQRDKSLWSSFVLKMDELQIYIGSDSGYSPQFKEIGAKFGKFDLAFLECGQYNENWPNIHSFPEQTVKEAKELNAEWVIPVHWGKFALANHPWNEPILRFQKEAKQHNVHWISPRIGETYILGEAFTQTNWWEF